MPFTSGKDPSYGEYIKTNELPQLKKSGKFLLEIANASYYHGTSKNTGNEYHQCALDTAVIYQGKPAAAARFSFFLPSPHMEALCYFLNLRDEAGNLSLPDPTHRTGTAKSGKEYDFYTFPCLAGKQICAVLEFTRENIADNGVMYSMFDLKGFCDEQTRSAVEVFQGAQSADHFKEVLEELRAKNAQLHAQYGGHLGETTAQQTSQVQQSVQAAQPSLDDGIPF